MFFTGRPTKTSQEAKPMGNLVVISIMGRPQKMFEDVLSQNLGLKEPYLAHFGLSRSPFRVFFSKKWAHVQRHTRFFPLRPWVRLVKPDNMLELLPRTSGIFFFFFLSSSLYPFIVIPSGHWHILSEDSVKWLLWKNKILLLQNLGESLPRRALAAKMQQGCVNFLNVACPNTFVLIFSIYGACLVLTLMHNCTFFF